MSMPGQQASQVTPDINVCRGRTRVVSGVCVEWPESRLGIGRGA